MNKKISFIVLLLIIFLHPFFVFAAGPKAVSLPSGNKGSSAADNSCSWNKSGGVYCMLAPLGNFVGNQGKIDLSNSNSFAEYLKTLYRMGIIVATGLAVIMITVGGLKYASTDAIDGKNEGKAIIQQSLLGLVLALMSYVLLQQINPALLRADFQVKGGSANATGKIEGSSNLLKSDSGGGATSNDGGVTTVPDAGAGTDFGD